MKADIKVAFLSYLWSACSLFLTVKLESLRLITKAQLKAGEGVFDEARARLIVELVVFRPSQVSRAATVSTLSFSHHSCDRLCWDLHTTFSPIPPSQTAIDTITKRLRCFIPVFWCLSDPFVPVSVHPSACTDYRLAVDMCLLLSVFTTWTAHHISASSICYGPYFAVIIHSPDHLFMCCINPKSAAGASVLCQRFLQSSCGCSPKQLDLQLQLLALRLLFSYLCCPVSMLFMSSASHWPFPSRPLPFNSVYVFVLCSHHS